MTIRSLVSLALISFVAIGARADLAPGSCPRQITLKGFRLPTANDIELAFHQVSGSYENQHADVRNFVAALAKLEAKNTIRLLPQKDSHGVCNGTIGAIPYAVSLYKMKNGVGAELAVDNNDERRGPTDAIGISLVNGRLINPHVLVGSAQVSFTVSLPSNCSNCIHDGNLFKITSIGLVE